MVPALSQERKWLLVLGALLAFTLGGCRSREAKSCDLDFWGRETVLQKRHFQAEISGIGPAFFWLEGCGNVFGLHSDSGAAIDAMGDIARRSPDGAVFRGILEGRIVRHDRQDEPEILVEKIDQFSVGDRNLRDALHDRFHMQPRRKDASAEARDTIIY